MSDIAVVYIARGKDPNWAMRWERFRLSWVRHAPGIDCQPYVIFKECDWEQLGYGMELFLDLKPVYLLNYNDHNSWGGGCFQEACNHVREPLLCTLVSTTEIMADDWLARLYAGYCLPDIGLAGCTGSRVANIHVRDTAIVIRKDRYLDVSRQFDFTKSKDGYLDFEHGPNNLTIQIMRLGLDVCIVEKERIIRSAEWPSPTTYQGNLHNVLVHDRGARDFNDL